MERAKSEAKALTKDLSEEGCEQCIYTKGEVTLQNIEGWSDISVAYQFYMCQFPIHFQIMKIMEWTYGVAFDGFEPKGCILKETKANYDQFFAKDGLLKFFMALKYGDDGIFFEQARKQIYAATGGIPPGSVEWYFMQPVSANYARLQFVEQGLNIKVFYKPMPIDYISVIFPD
ncbi:MAG: hypothetical protein XXXJIFNMEKO3_02657 [Candidatus Erwinia impunctatus]|nr:hypothetical protein XXXJIFNMEKO_02657 [Culicoides impunctatus]